MIPQQSSRVKFADFNWRNMMNLNLRFFKIMCSIGAFVDGISGIMTLGTPKTKYQLKYSKRLAQYRTIQRGKGNYNVS